MTHNTNMPIGAITETPRYRPDDKRILDEIYKNLEEFYDLASFIAASNEEDSRIASVFSILLKRFSTEFGKLEQVLYWEAKEEIAA